MSQKINLTVTFTITVEDNINVEKLNSLYLEIPLELRGRMKITDDFDKSGVPVKIQGWDVVGATSEPIH